MAEDPARLRAAVERAAGPEGELRFRPMFGGIMVYAGGRPFASLSDVGLALKLGPAERAELLALPGARPLQYGPDQPVSKNYVVLPAAVVDDPALLAPWLRRSAVHVAAVPAKAPRRRRPGSVAHGAGIVRGS